MRTWTVRRVLRSSRGYVHRVELTPATAPAIDEGGNGIFGCSPGFGDSCFLTVSYANNCMFHKMSIAHVCNEFRLQNPLMDS